jgi:thiol-disulfide isomerase/thioredoxin
MRLPGARTAGTPRIHRSVLLCLALWSVWTTGCQHPAASRSGGLTWSWIPVDGDGQEVVDRLDARSRAVVLVFLGTECPIAQRMLPELERLERELGPRGVRFLAVYPNTGETREGVRQQRRRAGLTGEAGLDPDQRLVDRWGVTVTPEVVSLAADGALIYRGRVNDQYAALGKGKPVPIHHDLREALEAFLVTGRARGVRTAPVGCRILRVP